MKEDHSLKSVFKKYVFFAAQELKRIKESLHLKQKVIYTQLGERYEFLKKN